MTLSWSAHEERFGETRDDHRPDDSIDTGRLMCACGVFTDDVHGCLECGGGMCESCAGFHIGGECIETKGVAR